MEKDALVWPSTAGANKDRLSSQTVTPWVWASGSGRVQQTTSHKQQDKAFWRVSAVIHFITALHPRESEPARYK